VTTLETARVGAGAVARAGAPGHARPPLPLAAGHGAIRDRLPRPPAPTARRSSSAGGSPRGGGRLGDGARHPLSRLAAGVAGRAAGAAGARRAPARGRGDTTARASGRSATPASRRCSTSALQRGQRRDEHPALLRVPRARLRHRLGCAARAAAVPAHVPSRWRCRPRARRSSRRRAGPVAIDPLGRRLRPRVGARLRASTCLAGQRVAHGADAMSKAMWVAAGAALSCAGPRARSQAGGFRRPRWALDAARRLPAC